MVGETAVEARFRKRVRHERDRRKWSQADLAKLLSDKGIKGIYPTTIAKIETGERSVKIDEAAALADLFEVSLDALLGRRPGVQTNELVFQLRFLRDTARQSSHQVWASIEAIREQLEGLPTSFEGANVLQELGDHTWRDYLNPAYEALLDLMNVSQEFLGREQGQPELSQEPVEELLSRIYQHVRLLQHVQGERTEADDEAQS